jgi:hypothetical protein
LDVSDSEIDASVQLALLRASVDLDENTPPHTGELPSEAAIFS